MAEYKVGIAYVDGERNCLTLTQSLGINPDLSPLSEIGDVLPGWTVPWSCV